ncbi:uncharacterized protein LDX57_009722 [Aspergillus melleus]|uniref:uncharacterized protein n=1 Tax=Aspergillus melleus TaxID=138277 RepID=UPI001E8E497E|nr:uncharacterized protein LDX57_009722 [Aspergillus melleus]KAH8432075.1 hypothetical protein LDX57_009722 [Aspergillus melleus]
MENKGPGMIAASIVLTTVAFLLFCLRTYAQHLTSSQIHLDEIFLAIGLILTIGLCIETCLCFYWGAGRHLADILATDPDPLVNQRKYWISGYVSVVNWAVAVFVIKLSLLSMYTRIFNTKSTPNRWFRYAVYGVIAYVISSSIAIIFSYIFICTPISFWWEQVNAVVGKPVPPGSCPNMIPRGVACAALNVVSDWLILSLGALGLWDLQMNRKRKLVVFGILGLGSTCCIVSIIRLPMLLSSSMSNDPTWSNSNPLLFGMMEASVGVISACLPGIAPLVKHWHHMATTQGSGVFSSGRAGSQKRPIHQAHEYMCMEDYRSPSSHSHRDTSPLTPARKTQPAASRR